MDGPAAGRFRRPLEATLAGLDLPRPVIDELVTAVGDWEQLDQEAAVEELVRRLVEAEHALAETDDRYRRLRGRRSVRTLTLAADTLRGRGSWRRFRDLVRRSPAVGDEPAPRSLLDAVTAPDGPVSPQRPRYLRPVARDTRHAYPYLQVGHVGPRTTFAAAAPHAALPGRPWQDELGYDLIVVEPDAGALPLAPEALQAARAAAGEVPIALVARDEADLGCVETPDVVMTADPRIAGTARARFPGATVLETLPGVDATTFNPHRWRSVPTVEALAYLEGGAAGARPAPDGLGDHALLVRPAAGAGPPAGSAGRGVELGPPVASSRELAEAVRDSRVVLAEAAWHPSETAYLRHVLSALAAGTPVVTGGSPRLEHLVAEGGALPALRIARSGTELREALDAYGDPLARERASVITRRAVLRRHTRTERFEELLAAVGIPQRAPEQVSIVLSTKRPHLLEHALANVARQDHPDIELVLVLHGDGFDPATVERLVRVAGVPTQVLALPPERSFGDCLNAGIAATGGSLVLKMDDDDIYGPAFVSDLVLALGYSGAAVVGKYARFAYLLDEDKTLGRTRDLAEQYRKKVSGATMLMRREVAERFGFLRRSSRVDATFCRRVERAGGTLYVTHSFDFVFCRRGSGHTWTPADGHFEEDGPRWPGLATDVVFTTPVDDPTALMRWHTPP